MANSLQDVCITPRKGGGEGGGGGEHYSLFLLTVKQTEAASTFALDDFKTSVDQLQQIEFYFSVHCMKQRNKRRCVRSLTDQRKWRQNEVRTSMAQADHQTLTSFAVFQ